MKTFRRFVAILVLSLAVVSLFISMISAQQASAVVPTLVKFSGTLVDADGKPLAGTIGVTFLLYKDEQGGAPLWMETQNVTADKTGHYTVVLGSTVSQGLPTDLFASGEARWLAVQAQGQAEQPRVLLLSVPYALKAGDAQTLGGMPASAFMLAAPGGGAAVAASVVTTPDNSPAASPHASSDVTTSGGTANTIPLFTTGTNIQNSILTQSGTTAVNVGGKLNFPATGTATAKGGFVSRPETMVASVFNSSTSTAVPQTFQLQAEAANNDTSSASGTLNLLYASGTATPAETGLKITSKGLITFASGQTFPGTGPGTVKSVASGAGLAGGPITSSGTLSIATGGVANTMLTHDSVTITAGTDLTGGGVVALGGTTTLNLNTTKVPLLGAANNAFSGNLSTNGSLSTSNGEIVSGGAPGKSVVPGVVEVDAGGLNDGAYLPGLTFGSGGQSIASTQQSGGPNYLGIDFYTNQTVRMSITNSGEVGIGTTTPGAGLQVNSQVAGNSGIAAAGANGDSTTAIAGGDGVDAYGANGYPSDEDSGGAGVLGYGGTGGVSGGFYGGDGAGGYFQGGSGTLFGDGVDASAGSGLAGNFTGDVSVSGNLSKGGGSFKIDHPLDPANKYLYHSFVESPDMMNIYNGNITTNGSGTAVVTMPEWFEALNRDFRYQLTVIGSFAQAIIAEELAGGQFVIRTDKANVKVSWQITGIRQDAWANAHRIPVEESKNARERGFYLHPELYGAPADKQIEWARHPQAMKKLQLHQRQMDSQIKQAKILSSKKR